MKKRFKLTLFISLTLVMIGCQKKIFHLNEEFTLDYNKSAFILIQGEKNEIKFTRLVEDSRCPPDVQCVWAGQVAVQINLDKETDLLLGHHTEILETAFYKDHIIRLIAVNYDKKENFGKEKHCSIVLKIE